jgi:integrase
MIPIKSSEESLTELQDLEAMAAKLLETARNFLELRLHDLRGTHETTLLDAGVPVHVVAARCGHDPAVLLRSYAKHSKKADTSAAAIIGALSKASCEAEKAAWVQVGSKVAKSSQGVHRYR